jgi:hypothetical protein
LKDEEFQRYVEFAESESGKRYHRVILAALKDAMKTFSLDLAKALGDLYKRVPREDDKVVSDKILVHLNDGRILIWNNYTEKGNRYCTWMADGEFCINKSDVSSI